MTTMKKQNGKTMNKATDLNDRNISKYFECMRRRDPILSEIHLRK